MQTCITKFEDADSVVVTRSPTDVEDDLHDFKTFIINQDKPLLFSGRNVKIQRKSLHMLRMRFCPPEDYEDFTDSLKIEEGLCPASPIIQIEDFDSFLSNTCKFFQFV